MFFWQYVRLWTYIYYVCSIHILHIGLMKCIFLLIIYEQLFAISQSVTNYIRGRDVILLEKIWLDKYVCGVGVINMFGQFSRTKKD